MVTEESGRQPVETLIADSTNRPGCYQQSLPSCQCQPPGPGHSCRAEFPLPLTSPPTAAPSPSPNHTHSCLSPFLLVIPSRLPLELCMSHLHCLLSVSSEMTKMTGDRADKPRPRWPGTGSGLPLAALLCHSPHKGHLQLRGWQHTAQQKFSPEFMTHNCSHR